MIGLGVGILSTFVGKYTTYCGSSDVDGKKGNMILQWMMFFLCKLRNETKFLLVIERPIVGRTCVYLNWNSYSFLVVYMCSHNQSYTMI